MSSNLQKLLCTETIAKDSFSEQSLISKSCEFNSSRTLSCDVAKLFISCFTTVELLSLENYCKSMKQLLEKIDEEELSVVLFDSLMPSIRSGILQDSFRDSMLKLIFRTLSEGFKIEVVLFGDVTNETTIFLGFFFISELITI